MSKPVRRQETPDIITSISGIANRYDYFILDIFGVIHDGLKAFPGTVDCLKRLKDARKNTCLLSNTPRRAAGAIEQMESMGISRDLYDHIVTSGESAFHALQNRTDDFHISCGKKCLFIGSTKMDEILEELNLERVYEPENASFILNSIPGTQPGDTQALNDIMARAARCNLPMICANPDLVVNIGSNQFQCAGTFAKLYEDLGGKVLYHGKPHTPVYERCHTLFYKPAKSAIVAVGDSFHTDITGADKFGIDSVLNLDGIHGEEVAGAKGTDPAKLKRVLQSQPHSPTYIIEGFAW